MTYLYISIFSLIFSLIIYQILLYEDKANKKIISYIVLIIFILANSLYYFGGGATQQNELFEQSKIKRNAHDRISALKTRIKEKPKDIAALMEISSIYIAMHTYDKSLPYLKSAILVSGGDLDIIFTFSKAMVLNNNGNVDENSLKGFQLVTSQQDDNLEAKYFIALYNLQNHEEDIAIVKFTKLLKKLSPESKLAKIINNHINDIEE